MRFASKACTTLIVTMLILAGSFSVRAELPAASEAPISSLETFREFRTKGEAAKDFAERAVCFRRALTWPEKHDEWLQLAREYSEALLHTYPKTDSPIDKESRSLLCEIVRRFGHMGLYSLEGPQNVAEVAPILPNPETATLDDYIQYIAVLQDFCDRRVMELQALPQPAIERSAPNAFLDSDFFKTSYGEQVERWLEQKMRAGNGQVFSEFELSMLDGTVRNCTYRFREQNDAQDSVPGLAELGARFHASAILESIRKYVAIESPPHPPFPLPVGKVVEVTLHGDRLNGANGPAKLDFDTGNVVTNPMIWSSRPQQSLWMKRGGLDFEVDYHWDFLMNIVTIGCDLFEVPGTYWEAAPATDEVLAAAALENGCLRRGFRGDDQLQFSIAASTTLPVTFAFRTREGCHGLLRLTAMREVASNVREYDIQYRVETPGVLAP